MILVDTNILLDLVTSDRQWVEWSQQRLDSAAARARSRSTTLSTQNFRSAIATIEELDEMIRRAGLINAAIPPAALFLSRQGIPIISLSRRYQDGGLARCLHRRPRGNSRLHADHSRCCPIQDLFFCGNNADRPELISPRTPPHLSCATLVGGVERKQNHRLPSLGWVSLLLNPSYRSWTFNHLIGVAPNTRVGPLHPPL